MRPIRPRLLAIALAAVLVLGLVGSTAVVAVAPADDGPAIESGGESTSPSTPTNTSTLASTPTPTSPTTSPTPTSPTKSPTPASPTTSPTPTSPTTSPTPASPTTSPTTPTPKWGEHDPETADGSGEIGVASGVVVRNETNTTNFLTIRDQFVERQQYANSTLDVAGSLAMDAERLQQRQAALSFEAAFRTASNQSARVTVVERELAAIEAEIEALKKRQQSTLSAYNAGDISTQELFRRLARLDASARALEDRLSTIRSVSTRTVGFRLPSELSTRINNVEARLVPLRGTVRARLAGAMTGDQSETTAYALTSNNGIILATIDDRTFLREAYLAGKRKPGLPDRFRNGELSRISVAIQRASELYPWTYSIPAPPSIKAFGNTSVYNITDTHPHGELTAYLDGATEDIYRELQRKRLDVVPTYNVSNTNGTLRVHVEHTHSTGPMQIRVTDTATERNATVNATIYVNGDRVGTTGQDGELWTVVPLDGVRIRAITPDGRVVRVRFFAR